MSGLDLFGLPIDPRHGLPGRPRHVPTPALRAEVRRLKAEGFDQLSIAAAVGLSGPTLRLHYALELESKSQAGRKLAERDAQTGEATDGE